MDDENKTSEPQQQPAPDPAQQTTPQEPMQGEIDILHGNERPPEPPAAPEAQPADQSMAPPPGQVITPGQAPDGTMPAPQAPAPETMESPAMQPPSPAPQTAPIPGAVPATPGTPVQPGAPAQPGDPAAPQQPPQPVKVQWCPTDKVAVALPDVGNTCPACGTPLVPLPPEFGPE